MTVCSHPEIQEQKQEWAGLPGRQCGTWNTWLIFSMCLLLFKWCKGTLKRLQPTVLVCALDTGRNDDAHDEKQQSNNSWAVFSGWAFLCRVCVANPCASLRKWLDVQFRVLLVNIHTCWKVDGLSGWS